jgi:hypothetical protein
MSERNKNENDRLFDFLRYKGNLKGTFRKILFLRRLQKVSKE